MLGDFPALTQPCGLALWIGSWLDSLENWKRNYDNITLNLSQLGNLIIFPSHMWASCNQEVVNESNAVVGEKDGANVPKLKMKSVMKIILHLYTYSLIWHAIFRLRLNTRYISKKNSQDHCYCHRKHLGNSGETPCALSTDNSLHYERVS